MTISVYVPAALSLLLAAMSRVVALRIAPARTAVVVVAAGLCAAAATWDLVLLAATLLGNTPFAEREASERGVQLHDPVPEVIAIVAAALLVLGAVRLVRVVRARRATGRELRRICDSCCGGGELAVVAMDAPHAFAVPGGRRRPGRILVTRGLLAVLDGDERRVVLAHERAHLRRRHHWLRAATDLCAAAIPVLVPVRNAVAYLVERNADEYAAAVTGSRELVARALAKAATAGAYPAPPGALAFTGDEITARVAALRTGPPPADPLVPGGVLALGLATAVAATQATIAFYQLIYWLWPA